MNYFLNDKKKNKDDLISILKLAALFLCVIAFYNEIRLKYINVLNGINNSYFNIIGSSIMVLVIILLYLFWLFFSINILKIKYVEFIKLFEIMIFFIIFSILIIVSNSYISQYKFLFLFIIVTSTLQSGMKYGMIISFISSFIILAIDIIYVPNTTINTYFQNDLILAGVFIMFAWTLGYYVKIEDENLRNKNLELQQLNIELNKRKHIEEMFIKNKSCYDTLIENSRDAIFVQRDGKFIFANVGAAKFLGFNSPEELTGKSILDFTPEGEKDKVKEKFQDIYNQKLSMLVFEGKIIDNKKNIIDIKNTSIYFIYEGEPTILSIFRDITSENQVKKLQNDVKENIELLNETREMNKMITEFFSNISHELKTPLHVIFSAIQLLSLYNKTTEEESYNKQNEYLDVMKKNCYRLMRLINNILDMTILDSGFLKLNLKNYNIVSVVEDVTMSVATFAESKQINFVFDTEVEEKIMAFDSDKIERVILNLLSNAIKFTGDGGKIYVNVSDKRESISISIKDTGTGIPKDKLKTIFERFEQVDKTFRRDCEGAGIGLSLVKSLVEMHNGTIEVNSKYGEGSEFIINLPVVLLDEECQKVKFEVGTNIEMINLELSDINPNIKSKK